MTMPHTTPTRARMVVEFVGYSPNGFVVLDVVAEGAHPAAIPGRLRIVLPSPDVPYKEGQHFWIEPLPDKPVAALLDKRL
jgi:hypothetical protein